MAQLPTARSQPPDVSHRWFERVESGLSEGHLLFAFDLFVDKTEVNNESFHAAFMMDVHLPLSERLKQERTSMVALLPTLQW